jgi:hypothetical protein
MRQPPGYKGWLPMSGRLLRLIMLSASIAFAAACGDQHETLSDRIDRTVRQKGELNLSEVTDFPWDSVVIFEPYSKRTHDICPRLRSVWPSCEAESLEPLWESDIYLVFIANGTVVRGEMHVAKNGDFCPGTCPPPGSLQERQPFFRQAPYEDIVRQTSICAVTTRGPFATPRRQSQSQVNQPGR